MLKLILGLGLAWSASASAALIPNKCWNTSLSSQGERACAVCEPLVEEAFPVTCATEIQAVADCFNDFDACGEGYRDILDAKDNCKTTLTNSCFLEQLEN